MERDMDLCREILRQMAAHRDLNSRVEIKVEDRSPDEIAYNVYLLQDGGLSEALRVSDVQQVHAYLPLWLTWKGCEFYEATKDDTIWRRGKELAIKAGGGLSYDALSTIFQVLIRQGLPGLGI
jgi:hypothetical protein